MNALEIAWLGVPQAELVEHPGGLAMQHQDPGVAVVGNIHEPLPGVGRKTANVVLGNAFGKNEGIVVDTHVIRLSQRFKLTTNRDAEKIERDLMKIVPQRDWTLWSHWLIWHGRRRCFARKPDCANCEVFALCPSGRIFLRTGEAKKT